MNFKAQGTPLEHTASSFARYFAAATETRGLTVGAVARASGISRGRLRDYRDGRRNPTFRIAQRIGEAFAYLGVKTNEFESTNEFEALWAAGYRRECVTIVGIHAAGRDVVEQDRLWSATMFDVLRRGEWPGSPRDLRIAILQFRHGNIAPVARWQALSMDPNLSSAERWGFV